jgi:uncharacterized membrane protein
MLELQLWSVFAVGAVIAFLALKIVFMLLDRKERSPLSDRLIALTQFIFCISVIYGCVDYVITESKYAHLRVYLD